MKNTKLQIRKLAKAGFSLVEMLVVIAVIGIIAAIAIPNIGNVNKNARKATAQRNAQAAASVFSSAVAAGAAVDTTDVAAAVDDLSGDGVSPTTGAFNGKVFVLPNVPATGSDERTEMEAFLEVDSAGNLNYVASPASLPATLQ